MNAMETDAAIVRRAIEGDERAMRLLWNQHAPHVDAVVRRLAGDPDLAQDIAQEVWIQIFRALPSWRGDAKFSTWIHRVAINRTLNAMRRVKRLSTMETGIDEDSAVVEQDAERSMLAQTIAEATRKLSPGARTVFLLHDVEGYTHEEIAVELGITPGGSKSQLFKARAKLRRLLAPLVDVVVPVVSPIWIAVMQHLSSPSIAMHLSAERLAAFDHEPFTIDELAHLAACAACRAERDAMVTLVSLAAAEAPRAPPNTRPGS